MDNEETIIKKLHPHPFYFFDFYFGGFAFIVASFFIPSFFWILLMIGIFVFVLAEIARRAETFYVLDSGVAREYRLLSTSRESAPYDRIQNIKITQSFFENMLGIGNIYFDTAGGDVVEVSFHGVKGPYGIESIVREKM